MTTASKPEAYPAELREMMAEKSRLLMQAQTFADIALQETARPLWVSAGSLEERIAPLLDALGRAAEASLHRISAASCFEQAERFGHAVNLYRAALAGPLPSAREQEVQAMLANCLRRLASADCRAAAGTTS
jgi:hypothetical protein